MEELTVAELLQGTTFIAAFLSALGVMWRFTIKPAMDRGRKVMSEEIREEVRREVGIIGEKLDANLNAQNQTLVTLHEGFKDLTAVVAALQTVVDHDRDKLKMWQSHMEKLWEESKLDRRLIWEHLLGYGLTEEQRKAISKIASSRKVIPSEKEERS